MNIRSGLFAILALAFASTGANAATYDITTNPYGTNDAPVLFSAPGTGTVTLGATPPVALPTASQIFGQLAGNALVTFTYSLANFTSLPILVGTSNGMTENIAGNANGSLSFATALIKVVASITGIGGANPEAIISFQNLTGATSPIFEADLLGATTGVTGNVNVSSVPLPASLPLFFAAALLLAGIGMYKRNQQA